MQDHAFYVWTSYGLGFAALIWIALSALVARRRGVDLLRSAREEAGLNAAVSPHAAGNKDAGAGK